MPSEKENPDFEGLEKMNLSPKILAKVKSARIEARNIIEHLEPEHISSWGDLIEKLEHHLKEAKNLEKMNSPLLKH